MFYFLVFFLFSFNIGVGYYFYYTKLSDWTDLLFNTLAVSMFLIFDLMKSFIESFYRCYVKADFFKLNSAINTAKNAAICCLNFCLKYFSLIMS